MMQALHRQPLPAARSKSLVMLVEEYAAKSRLTVGPPPSCWCGGSSRNGV